MNAASLDESRLGDVKERPDVPASSPVGYATHTGQPPEPGPGRHPHEERLGLIVERMAGDEVRGADLQHEVAEQAIARGTCAGLRHGSGPTIRPDQEVVRQAEPLGRNGDRLGLRPGAQPHSVIDGRDLDPGSVADALPP